MKVLHFGAGNIGRGFIGKLLSESGFEVIFVDVNQPVIDLINKAHTPHFTEKLTTHSTRN